MTNENQAPQPAEKFVVAFFVPDEPVPIRVYTFTYNFNMPRIGEVVCLNEASFIVTGIKWFFEDYSAAVFVVPFVENETVFGQVKREFFQ